MQSAAIREDVPVDEVSRDLERLSHEALVADQPVLAATVAAAQAALERAEDAFDESAAREQLALAMNDFVVTATDPVGLEAVTTPAAERSTAIPASAAAANDSSVLEEDAEMREIFLEEAREVLDGAQAALAELAAVPINVEQMTTLRRAFHTLKGSSRMVGLNEFGEAAWSCEQLFNARLAEAPHADEALLSFSGQALAYLGDWVQHIASREAGAHEAGAVRAAADALRLDGHLRPLPLPAMAKWDDFAPASLPSDLPTAADLDLPPVFEVMPAAEPQQISAAPEVSFELSLRALDEARAESMPQPDSTGDMPTSGASIEVPGPAEDRAVAQPIPVESIDSMDEGFATVPLPLLDDIARAEADDAFEVIARLDLNLTKVASAGRGSGVRLARDNPSARRRGRPRSIQGRRPVAHRHSAVQHFPQRGR